MNEYERLYRIAENLKVRYPKGTRIEVISMGEDPRPIPSGTRGTVEVVDDMATVHCTFDNGRYLGLAYGEDHFRVLTPEECYEEKMEKNLEKYKDQEIEFVVTEFNPRRRRIIGDRKQLLVARKKELQKELFERIHVGDRVEGVVKNVTDFGAFIDLGGADGLLHISEMSWGHVENPKKVFKVGENVEVMIKNINPENGKIALTRKFPDANPWNDAEEKYAAGTIISGRVARMTDFGAFVELEPGVDALLHVSQISHEHVDKPSDVLKVGQEIEAKIVDFNGEDHKISLSMKALESAAPKKADEE